MSKRNFILLIIILTIIVAVIFGFLFFLHKVNNPGDAGTGTNFISQFNPFASTPKPPVIKPPVDVTDNNPPPVNTTPSKLTKVSSMPVAGYGIFSKERIKNVPAPVAPVEETGTAPSPTSAKTTKPTPPLTEFIPAVRYVARGNGNIYQTFADKIEERKFSTTVVPRVYEAIFGNHGQVVVMRYLKNDGVTITTFVGTLPKELLGGDTGGNEVKGYFLPDNVKDISLSPDTSKIFYLFLNASDLTDTIIGATLNFLNNKKIQVFDSAFTEWLSQWPENDSKNSIITLTTKPSSAIPGYMYSIDSAGKNLTKTLGDINGLTTLQSPNGKLILYGDSSLSLNIYHTDTRNSDVLGVKTMPEKCVWGTMSDVIYCSVPKTIDPGEYPDTWYQGEVSFNDQIWKIDVKTGNTTMINDPIAEVKGEEIDGIKLAFDEGENYLFFVNKKDSFLWKLNLK